LGPVVKGVGRTIEGKCREEIVKGYKYNREHRARGGEASEKESEGRREERATK